MGQDNVLKQQQSPVQTNKPQINFFCLLSPNWPNSITKLSPQCKHDFHLNKHSPTREKTKKVDSNIKLQEIEVQNQAVKFSYYLIKQKVNGSFIFNSITYRSPKVLNIQLDLLKSTSVKSLESDKFL